MKIPSTLGIVAKQATINTIIMYTGAAIGAVNTILLYPSIMPKEEYGMIATFTSVGLLLAVISGFGTSSSIVKFIPHFRNKDSKSNGGLLTYLLMICFSFSIITTIALVVFKSQLTAPYEEGANLLVEYYYFIIPFFVINLFIELFSSYANMLFKSNFQIMLKEIFVRLLQMLLIGLYYYNVIDFYGFIVGYIITYALSLGLLLLNLMMTGNFTFANVKLIEKSEKKGIFWYGGTTFLASVASTFAFRIDALMIGAMVVSATNTNYGLEAVAIYAVALNIASVIEMPFRAISQIANPMISGAWKDNDLQKINSIYSKATETMIVIGSYVFMGIWCCIDDVIKILPDDYSSIKYVFLWLGLGKFINVAFGTNGHIIINSAFFKIFTWLSFFGLIFTFTTNYFFISIYNEVGAALATSITYFVLNMIMFLYLITKFKFQPFKWNNLLVMIIAVFFALSLAYIDFGIAMLNIVVKGILLTIAYWGIILKFRLSDDIYIYLAKIEIFRRLRIVS